MTDEFILSCPAPSSTSETVQLAHGGGGRAMAGLIDRLIRPAFTDAELDRRHDGAILKAPGTLAFTTDSYVVRPLVFPGGDIGTLAIYGTVNDLAMCGARPLCISVGLIIEEGLPFADLERIIASMRDAAAASGVRVVTGDTKVVDRGKADGLFINTSGIGEVMASATIGPEAVQPGDAVIISGDIGRHGIAVMSAREGFAFESEIKSDCAPVHRPVTALIAAGIEVHCLRDLTRGGLASSLVEIAESAEHSIAISEDQISVHDDVAAACELLGFDPMHVANEGRFIALVPQDQVEHALAILKTYEVSAGASVIGEVKQKASGIVTCRTALGTHRVIDMLSGEQLPRIC